MIVHMENRNDLAKASWNSFLVDNDVDLSPVCKCGRFNDWIKTDECSGFWTFWGCEKCYQEKMRPRIKPASFNDDLLKKMEEVIEGFKFTKESDVVKRHNAGEYMEGYVDGLEQMRSVVRRKIE